MWRTVVIGLKIFGLLALRMLVNAVLYFAIGVFVLASAIGTYNWITGPSDLLMLIWRPLLEGPLLLAVLAVCLVFVINDYVIDPLSDFIDERRLDRELDRIESDDELDS